MAVVIRLRKPGKSAKKRYHYKIVVDEKRSKIDGRFIAQVGHYDPSQEPEILKIDLAKYELWYKKGARPSDTVKSLVRRFRRSSKKGE